MEKLRESNMHNSGRKIIYSNSANIITPSGKTRSSNVQVFHILKVFKPKISAKQFNELSGIYLFQRFSSAPDKLTCRALLGRFRRPAKCSCFTFPSTVPWTKQFSVPFNRTGSVLLVHCLSSDVVISLSLSGP